MQSTVTIIALAAGLGQVAATGFKGAPMFNYPGNTPNQCIPQQVPGYNWGDLTPGGFDKYNGFKWSGYTCANKFGKRDALAARTSGFQDKCITGTAHPDKSKCPSFSCDKDQGLERTSVKEFYITVEFDCDMEFHYDMPDGSTCKHRSACKSAGTVVQNTQCGGAKGVTVVYPSQPAKPKPSCDYGIHSIGFDCNSYSTKPMTSTATTVSTKATTSSVPVTTTAVTTTTKATTTTSVSSSVYYSTSMPSSSTMLTSTKPSTSEGVPSTTPGSVYVPSTTAAPSTSSDVKPTTSSAPASIYSSMTFGNSSSSSVASTSVPVVSGSYSVPGASGSTSVPAVYSSTSVPVVYSSSSVYTTVPGSSSVYSTVAISTTSAPGYSSYEVQSSTSAAGSSSVVYSTVVSSTSSNSPVTGTSSAPGPIETLPCPEVVPSCLNTFLDMVGNCKDNTDTACFCPKPDYVKTIYDCIYAHGQTDSIISEAITYFQGICASHCQENPAIITGAAPITSIITVTPVVYSTAVYTTIRVDVTQVMPVTGDNGITISGSSTTVYVSTTLAVPAVGFATITAGAATSVAVVPGGGYATAIPTATATAKPIGGGSGYPTTLITAPAGSQPVASSRPTSSVVTAGAANVRSGLGLSLLGLAALAVAAL